jgi:integrase
LALAGAAYDSGLRRGDLWKLRHEWLADDGSIRLRQSKTNEPHLCGVTPHVLALVRSIPYECPLKWTGHSDELTALWREACEAAGVRHGCTQQIRRTAATVVWESHPELVQQFLGHRSPEMWRFYVDKRRKAKPIMPARNFQNTR